MTLQDRRDLAARLVIHADHVERIGADHPAYRYPALAKDLRDAAQVLRANGETIDGDKS